MSKETLIAAARALKRCARRPTTLRTRNQIAQERIALAVLKKHLGAAEAYRHYNRMLDAGSPERRKAVEEFRAKRSDEVIPDTPPGT